MLLEIPRGKYQWHFRSQRCGTVRTCVRDVYFYKHTYRDGIYSKYTYGKLDSQGEKLLELFKVFSHRLRRYLHNKIIPQKQQIKCICPMLWNLHGWIGQQYSNNDISKLIHRHDFWSWFERMAYSSWTKEGTQRYSLHSLTCKSRILQRLHITFYFLSIRCISGRSYDVDGGACHSSSTVHSQLLGKGIECSMEEFKQLKWESTDTDNVLQLQENLIKLFKRIWATINREETRK